MDISKKDFDEAIEEMREMNSRNSMPPVPPFVKMRNDNADAGENASSYGTAKTEKPKLFSKDILKFLDMKNFELDSDRILLLLMMTMLSGNSGDEILLFALAYIML